MTVREGPNAQMVRYADDLVVCTRKDPRPVLETLRRFLGELDLELHLEKTRLVDADKGGFDFLGFHFRKAWNQRTKKKFPLMIPSRKARARLVARIRFATRHRRTDKVEVVVQEVNPIIRGWVNYFRIGNSADVFQKARDYIERKLSRYVFRKKHRRGFGGGKYPKAEIYDRWGLFNDYRIRYGA